MPKYMIAGNWKMNTAIADVPAYVSEYSKQTESCNDTVARVLGVPYTHLAAAVKACKDSKILVVSQNCHHAVSGAYTGEISIPMLKEIGVHGAIVGHSERRQYFGETNTSVALKVAALQEAGLLPIACVGESQDERESGKTNEVVSSQLNSILSAANDSTNLVIAYEPVWAIGTGLAATPEMAEEVHAMIREMLVQKFADKASEVKVLYGGSMKPANTKDLLSEKNIDGGLVGGASLKAGDFAEMAKIACSM